MTPTLSTEHTQNQPDREAFAWGWGLDVLMALLILVVLNAVASWSWRAATFKARASEQVLATTTLRTDVIEHYAVTGDWSITDGNVPGNFASAAPGTIEFRGRAAAGIVDGVIVTLGRYPEHPGGPTIMAFRPLVPRAPEQPTVRWRCGDAPAPAGWHGPQVSPAANLPDEYLLSQCRKRVTG